MKSMAVPLAGPEEAGEPGVFALDRQDRYLRWRDAKLRNYPRRVEELMVEVRDPRRLTDAERGAILDRCARANMAIYVSRETAPDTELPRRLAEQFGLHRLDANWLADEDGISHLSVVDVGTRGEFIPYTDRAIRWHTDGYYNPPSRRIRAMVLHCVRDAASGGENELLDHELAYIHLRDTDPELVRALMAPDAMLIPSRDDADGVARPAESGPVFHVSPADGRLHMRYTARTTSIAWKPDAATTAAIGLLGDLLQSATPWILRARLKPGSGLICNNVLHNRAKFTETPEHRRLLYRARYLEPIA